MSDVPPRRAAPRPIAARTKIVYALGDHTVNVALSSLGFFYLHFLTDTVGLRPLLAGFVRWIGPLVDAFTDPIMGRISDRTRWRAGRRRPYFLLGAIPFGISYALLWSEAPFDGQLARFAWYGLAYVVFGIGVTIVSVPYLALIPEMAPGYQERTSVNAYRSGGAMLGVGVALAMLVLSSRFGGDARAYALAGACVAVWLVLPWLGVYAVSWETGGRRRSQVGFLRGMRTLARHRAYRLVAGLYICSRIAVDLVTALLLFYFTDWLGRSQADFLLTMALFILGLVGALPIWLSISRHVEKRTLFALGAGVWIAVQLVFVSASPEWPLAVLVALGALVGAAYGAVEMMPWSMLADVVDEDELRNGERREGLYSGFFMFLRKLAGPTALLAVGGLLEWSGYTGEGRPPETAVQTIRIVTAFGPVLFLAASLVLALRYPLTREAHAAIVAALDGGREGADGLRP